MSIIGQQVGQAIREAEYAGTLGRPIDLSGVLEGEEQIKRGEWVSLRTLREELEQAWRNPTAEQRDANAKDALIADVFGQSSILSALEESRKD